ncbi:MAG: sigma-70 family RNA polymerase sigma factor [Gemmatimonadales bacterium]
MTRLLQSWRAGDETAADRLFPLVYQELRRAAEAQLRRERPGHTLQATALVHEVYLKLAGDRSPQWENRGHFLGIAARAMRQLLVDHARRRNAAKRGGGQAVITLGDAQAGMEMPVEEVIALDDALTRLDAANPRLRQVVELRFFAGLTEDETAQALGVTTRTTQRDWVKARAWLYKELYGEERSEK